MPPFSPESFDPADVVNKIRGAEVPSDRLRRYIFNRSLDTGELEDQISELYENLDLDEDESDYDVFRQNVTYEDFPGRIPYRGYDIDPDYEDLSSFHLAGQNPKIRSFLESNQPFELSSPAGTQEAIYQAWRRGDINNRDLAALNTAGYSEILSRGGYDPESVETVSELVRGVTRNDAPYEELIPRVGDVLDVVDPVISPVNRNIGRYESALSHLSRSQNFNPFTQNVPVNPNMPRRSRPAVPDRQLGLPLVQQDPEVQAIVERGQNELPETFAQLTEESDILNRAVRSVASNPNNSNVFGPENVAEARVNLVLPQVERLFGSRSALKRAVYDDLLENPVRNSLYSVSRDLSRFASAPGYEETLSALERFPSQLDPRIPTPPGTAAIPGMEEELKRVVEVAKLKDTEEGVKKVQDFLEKYPEVGPYIQSPVRLTTPKIERDLEKLGPYIDIQQQISRPEDRQRIYNELLETQKVDADVLDQIERDYTSGEPYKQRRALTALEEFGGPEYRFELEKAAVPAASKRFPVVGGGGYGALSEGKKENQASLARISSRARDFNELINNLPESVREMLERSGPLTQEEVEQRYAYNPDTGKAFIDPQGEYGVMLSRGYTSPFFEPFDPSQLRQVESQNVLRFLADNPITGVNTISFKTQEPGEVYTYESKDIPRPVFDLMERFVKQGALEGLKPGTLVVNRPLSSEDIARNLEESGLTPEESSTLRRRESFIGKEPNARAAAYRAGGFGPLTSSGEQMAYINAEGNVVPLQARRADPTLRGEIYVNPREAEITQSRLPLTTRAYYSTDPLTSAARGASEFGRALRRTPSALLPGAADLIPSPEAIQTGYARGPMAMGKQMGQEFIQSLPMAAGTAGVLSTPLTAPFAPGVGAGLVGTAGARALNEIVRQETGEGIVPKFRQFIGTAPRTGATAQPRTGEKPLTATLKPLTSAQRSELTRQDNRNEIQKRIDLVKERFNPRRGEFGLSELLLGR